MSTGVKPRDDEPNLSRADLEAIKDAMKCKKFRDLLNEYCEEVRDPVNQALYQKEMTQLEKERGYDVTFINPKGSYVIKTSVAGDRKAFINICSNTNVGKPSCNVQEVNGQRGMNWQLPYSIIPPREDIDKNKQRCVVYDVVFHPDTLRMAEVNKRFRELVNKTAFDGLQNTYNIHFDDNNCRFPRLNYKGINVPAVIRKEDPNFVPTHEANDEMTPEIIEKLYPQKVYKEKDSEKVQDERCEAESKHHKTKVKKDKEFTHLSEKGYTLPKYVIKQQKSVDLQDYTYEKSSKQCITIPSHLLVHIYLPLLTSTKDCTLDVKNKKLNLLSEKPAKYKLDITLPYSVNDECGNAKFDKTKHLLTVTLPVHVENFSNRLKKPVRADSGIDSENNSHDEDEETRCLVEEIPSTEIIDKENKITVEEIENKSVDEFLEPSIGYTLPSYTYNALDDILALTFHVKNTDPTSVHVKKEDNKVFIKFSTIGTGFVHMYYAAMIIFEKDVKLNDAVGEAWDNNVILQLELNGSMPQSFLIGLHIDEMTKECIDLSHVNKTSQETEKKENVEDTAIVVVTNTKNETNIIVTNSNNNEETDQHKEKKIVWAESGHCENGAKSILRKPIKIMRSFSESSYGDVASSMDYMSSDCIPEESSLKKTVRFSDVIARQFYRFNSSIEGQKRKNQRKKSKKRSQDRKSESEAEEDTLVSIQSSKTRLRSVLKQRHDSGLADTSDAELDFKYTMSDSEVAYEKIKYPHKYLKKGISETAIDDDSEKHNMWATKLSKAEMCKKSKACNKQKEKTCDSIKHNTDFYDPDKLNKGQYTEVKFKNDLIFDLDM